MANKYSVLLRSAAVLVLAAMLGGCPSSSQRTTIDGYSHDMLVRKRIMVLAPEAADVTLSNAGAFATSRGTVAEGAQEQIRVDMRTRMLPAIAAQLDSNTVLLYSEQSVSGLVPLNATADFNGAEPKAWETIKRAGREGNIDYLIVLNGLRFTNSASGSGVGTESVKANYSLLDVKGARVMTSGTVEVPSQPAAPAAIYDAFARELASELPFHVRATAGE